MGSEVRSDQQLDPRVPRTRRRASTRSGAAGHDQLRIALRAGAGRWALGRLRSCRWRVSRAPASPTSSSPSSAQIPANARAGLSCPRARVAASSPQLSASASPRGNERVDFNTKTPAPDEEREPSPAANRRLLPHDWNTLARDSFGHDPIARPPPVCGRRSRVGSAAKVALRRVAVGKRGCRPAGLRAFRHASELHRVLP